MERKILLFILFAAVFTGSVYGAPVLPDTHYEFGKAGDTASVDIVLNGLSNGISGFKLQITPDKAGSIVITSIKFPEWVALKNTTMLPAESVIIKGVDLNRMTINEKNVVLATVEVKSNTGEKGSLKILPLQVDDHAGNPVFSSESNKAVESITTYVAASSTRKERSDDSSVSVTRVTVPPAKDGTLFESATSIQGTTETVSGFIPSVSTANEIKTDKGLSESSSTFTKPVFSPGIPVSTVPAKNDTFSQTIKVKKQPGFLIISVLAALLIGFIINRKASG